MDDVERIVAGLTPKRREAILSTDPDELRTYNEVSGNVRVALFRLGLLQSAGVGGDCCFSLAPLGLRVRQYLQEAARG